jgi:hypothetical protein
MQGYQIHAAVTHDSCRLISLRANASTDSTLAEVGRGSPAVPVSPGHARVLGAYPPSRCRRR